MYKYLKSCQNFNILKLQNFKWSKAIIKTCKMRNFANFQVFLKIALTARLLRSCVLVMIPWYNKLPNSLVRVGKEGSWKSCKMRNFTDYKFFLKIDLTASLL